MVEYAGALGYSYRAVAASFASGKQMYIAQWRLHDKPWQTVKDRNIALEYMSRVVAEQIAQEHAKRAHAMGSKR